MTRNESTNIIELVKAVGNLLRLRLEYEKTCGNPYPEYIIDECSGIKVTNDKHTCWQQGYDAK